MGRKRIGDIRNLRDKRLDKLDSAIRSSTHDLSDDKMDVGYTIEEIYVVGSWGEGRAIPTVSDLDLLVLVQRADGGDMEQGDYWPIEVEVSNSGSLHPIGRVIKEVLWPRFNGIDMWVAGSREELNEKLEYLMDNAKGDKVYSLTDRKTITKEDL